MSTMMKLEDLQRIDTRVSSNESPTHAPINVGRVERWASGVAGGLLAIHGLKRGSFGGLALPVLGGGLIYRGVTGHCQVYQSLGVDTTELDQHHAAHATAAETATIDSPPATVYAFLKNAANQVKYMSNVESVWADADGTWHWAMRGPFGSSWTVRTRLAGEVPDRMIKWESVVGGDVAGAGTIRIDPARDGRGSVVLMEMTYAPPAGTVGLAIAKLFGEDPGAQMRANLRRLKQTLEAERTPVAV
jgi:uncharacterized membrane protein